MGGGSGRPEIFADLSALAELADELARFAGGAVFGEARAANQRLNDHAPFGVATASGYVVAARTRYQQNLVRVVGTLHDYAREAASLSLAVGRAVQGYQGADVAAARRAAVPAVVRGGTVTTAGLIGPAAPQATRPAGFVGPVAPQAGLPAAQVAATPAPRHVAAGEAGEAGGWCTNWSAYDARALWEMVAPDNVCTGADQTLAWRRVADALDDQAGSLSRKRESFARAWSGGGGAGEAFLRRLDELISSMRQTAGAAAATCTAIEKINDVIGDVQRDLQQIHQEHEDKSGDLVLRQLDGAEDELNERARARMAKAEQEVSSAAAGMTPVPKFESRDPDVPIEQPYGSGAAGHSGDFAGAGSDWRSGDASLARRTPPAPMPGVDPVLPDGGQWTPGGGSWTPGGGSGGMNPDGSQLGGVSGVSLAGGGGTVGGPGLGPGVGGLPAGGGGAGYGAGGGYGGAGGAWAPAASGAVTGGSWSAGGAGAAGSAGGGLSGMGVPGMGMGVPPASGGRSRQDRGDVSSGYGDEQWEVEEGVAPVIEPGRGRKRHDPGPGVIGMNA